jgi:hypothetical protein
MIIFNPERSAISSDPVGLYVTATSNPSDKSIDDLQIETVAFGINDSISQDSV